MILSSVPIKQESIINYTSVSAVFVRYHIQVDVIDGNFATLLAIIEPISPTPSGASSTAVSSTPFTTSPRGRGSPTSASSKGRKASSSTHIHVDNDDEDDMIEQNVETGVLKDYLAVERAHEVFLASVVKGCFMQVLDLHFLC